MVYTSNTMEKVTRYIVLAALFLIPFIPLYVANGSFFPFIAGKGFAFRILVEIAFFGWLILAFANKEYRPRFSWTFLIYGVFAVWMFIANLFAIDPQKAFWSNFERMDGWVTIAHLLMFFVVAGVMFAKEALRQTWWRVFIAGAALTCSVGLLQLAGFFPINQGALRVDATFGNAIYFAVYLMFALGVTIWQAFRAQGWIRFALLVLAAVELVLLLLTASRGALIATFGALVFAALWTAWRAGPSGRKAAVATLVGLVVVVGGFFLVRNTPMVTSEPVIARLATVFSIGEELQTRFAIWDIALKGVAERPVTGWGQEGFNYVFTKYYEPSLYAQEPFFDRAHNTYLDWLIAGGVPALLLFLGLLLTSVIALMRAPITRDERLLLLSLLVAYGIQALVVFDNLFTYVPLIFILATAHIVSSRPIKSLEQAGTIPEEGLGIVVVPAVLAVFVAVLWLVNVPNIATMNGLITAQRPNQAGVAENYRLFEEVTTHNSFGSQEVAEQLAQFSIRVAAEPSIPDQVKLQFLSLALKEIDEEIARIPREVRLYLQRAAIFRAAGDYENAIRSIDAALAISPKKQTILIEKGLTLGKAGQTTSSRETFYEAYNLDTSFTDTLILFAASEIENGRVAHAHSMLLTEFGTTTVDHDALWAAYAGTNNLTELVTLQRLRISNMNDAPEQRFLLARILGFAGQKEEAFAEIAALVAEYPQFRADAATIRAQIEALP